MVKKKKKLHLKYEVKKFLAYFIVLLLITIYGISVGTKLHKQEVYENSYEYKLIQNKYPEEEAKKLSSTLSDEILEKLTKEKYNDIYYQIVNQKYFLNKNFQDYVDYNSIHKSTPLEKTIAIVNVKKNKKEYSTDDKTDINEGYLMLVNKYYHLEEDYERIDLEPFSLSIAYGSYGDNKAAKIVVEQFDKLQQDVKTEFNAQLMVTSSYRSYETQKKNYELYGDDYVARPGYSEHQTGLSIDIVSLSHTSPKSFFESDEGKWIVENCWQYGFILRYPEGTEDITGYDNEALHFRYVGETTAKKIKDENITFDEYYAYYIDK